MNRKINLEKPFYRAVTFDRAAVDDTTRQVRLSISSDVPYLRNDYFGEPYYEQLDHSPGGVDTSRLDAGLSICWNHDTNKLLGRSLSYQNDGHKISIVAKFSRSTFAQEVFTDILDEVAGSASIGYEILDAEETDQEINGIPVYRMRFLVLEASIVAVAADITVGVGRSHHTFNQTNNPMKTEDIKPNENQPQPNTRSADQERQRIQHINHLADRPNFRRLVNKDEVACAINEGWSKRAFTDFVMQKFGESAPESIVTDGDNPRGPGNRRNLSIAEQIVQHPQFAKVFEGGRKNISFELKSVRGFREHGQRSTSVTTDFGTTVDYLPTIRGVAFERLTLADLLAPGTMSTGKIIYPQETSFVSQADSVAEGAQKPEQAFDVTSQEASAKKIAAWTKISDELAQDQPAAISYIQARLGFAVEKKEDSLILYGDGIGSNMKGLLSQPGIQVQAKGADTILDAIRKGIANIDIYTDFMATGLVLNPADWATIEMLKDADGKYLVGQVTVPDEYGRPRLAPALWRLPIAISKSIVPGTSLVGAFATAAQLFRRTGMLIEIANTHEDDFTRNLLTILAEMRAALACYAPAAFCEVSGLAA